MEQILILLETQKEMHQYFSLLKKQKKKFSIFQTEQLKYYEFISFKDNINKKDSI